MSSLLLKSMFEMWLFSVVSVLRFDFVVLLVNVGIFCVVLHGLVGM